MRRLSPAFPGPWEGWAQGPVQLDRARRCQTRGDGHVIVRPIHAFALRVAGVARCEEPDGQQLRVGIGDEPLLCLQRHIHKPRWTSSC